MAYDGHLFRALLDGGYTLRVEDAVASFSQPRDIGTTKSALWEVALSGSAHTWRAKLSPLLNGVQP